MMGGEIYVKSEPEKGSTFFFTVTMEQATGQPADDADEEEDTWTSSLEQESFSGYCALLAEDVEINREIVLALFEPSGLKIDCAVNGAEAVRMFGECRDKYDVIFMDVQMPEMDGFEATRKIRAMGGEKAGEIPIIAMTANVFREDIERCLASGMNDHVGKPMDFKEVMSKLRKYLT
jgi:CheY-like chemotaxis protein